MTSLLRTIDLFKNRILILLIFFIFLGCIDNNTFYNKSLEPHPKGWGHTDSLKWIVAVNDSTLRYKINIGVRNDFKYMYQNIGLELSIINPKDSVLYKDTLDIKLTDENGKWKGDGWGSLLSNEVLVESNFMFPTTGDYSFVVRQAMRDHFISGIESVNLKITR